MKKQYLFFAVLCVTIISIFISCKKNNDVTPGRAKYTIYGTVVDYATGAPVDGATVVLAKYEGAIITQTVTGYDGNYELSLQLDPSVMYYIGAEKAGIGVDDVAFNLTGLGDNNTKRIDLTLRK